MSMLIGVASYLAPEKLRRTLETIREMTTGEWVCAIVHNESPEPENDWAVKVAAEAIHNDGRFCMISQPNSGYCGAVNTLIDYALQPWAEAHKLLDVDVIVSCDNDIEIRTRGWNEHMEAVLRDNPECGWVFPGDGHYSLENGRYRECLWHAGYCWMMSMKAREAVEFREVEMFNPNYLRAGYFNAKLGHHEEVDWATRLRLAGFTTACLPSVDVLHHETATQGDEAQHKPGGRIHDGVVRWMNHWNDRYVGNSIKYSMTAYDPRALRYTDWSVNALYLERMTLANFPNWNANPREVYIPGVGNMDAIEVLKPTGCYRGRAI